ncbi:hypothetical protein Agabi119p4_4684 [Agaricus bisporus var. burnettii]|uniref:Uncharacterized protein n=1 Tax=Agaricus bisporus var. burnettii TaxID=192524 RepID=A0A8H7F3T6_AGABI|nr:hypothetical protein Agabi119p4_4684 [Agaricus bisporus var. burnettii]
MFNGMHMVAVSTDVNLATQTLTEESSYRFHAFSADDAITLGLSIRKRFRTSSKHARGKGLVISIQTIAGHTLFSCTVGDLGHPSGAGDVSLDSWICLEGMVNVVKRTGHSSFYVEKGMSAMGKTAKQMNLEGDFKVQGGAFPIWLENAPCCPIAIVAAYSGSSQDDHNLVATTIRDYIKKLRRDAENLGSIRMPEPSIPHAVSEWPSEIGLQQPPQRPEGSAIEYLQNFEHPGESEYREE